MRYPTSLENLVRLADLTATNIIASSAFELTSREATGGGNIELTGAYTGADDAVFDIEILSDTISGTPTISAPVFSGVGNGTISSISATAGIAAQEFTVTVADLGTTNARCIYPIPGRQSRCAGDWHEWQRVVGRSVAIRIDCDRDKLRGDDCARRRWRRVRGRGIQLWRDINRARRHSPIRCSADPVRR